MAKSSQSETVSGHLNLSLSNPVLSVEPSSLKSFFFPDRRHSGTYSTSCLFPRHTHTHSDPPVHTLIFKSVCVCASVSFYVCVSKNFSLFFFPDAVCDLQKHAPLSSEEISVITSTSSSQAETEVETKGKMRPLREHSTSRLDGGCLLNRLCVWALIEYLVVIPAGTLI